MTTEVLRNMLLTDSDQVRSLGLVVLDEVHYLQDPFRGGVWEEVLILTPTAVRFVALSATIGNAPFLGQWLCEVRGPTAVVVEELRPITLHDHVALVRRGQSTAEVIDLLDGTRLAEEARRVDNLMKSTRRLPSRAQVARAQVQRPAAAVSLAAAQRAPPAPWSARTCCRSSCSSSRARPARTPCTSAVATGCASRPPSSASRSRPSPNRACATSATTTSSRSNTGSSSRRLRRGLAPAPRRYGARLPRDRRGLLRAQPARRRLRHRDAGAWA